MDIHETAFCARCGDITVHQRLGQGRLECTTQDCHETRDDGPLAMWDPAGLDPTCPTCGGRGNLPDAAQWTSCATCYGTGLVRSVDLPLEDWR